MNISVLIVSDLSRNSKALSSYSLHIGETDRAESPLRQSGPVHNNQLLYRGVFDSLENACRAVGSYVAMNFKIVEIIDVIADDVRYEICGAGSAQRGGEFPALQSGQTSRVVYARSSSGEYIAA